MVYEIAGLKVEMEPKFGRLTKACEGYRSSGTPVMTLTPDPRDEVQVQVPTQEEREYILHSAAFCREIIQHGRFFLHASGVVCGGEAFLFSGPSGTGKSTHTALWQKLYPGIQILNDDKPVIWPEKGHITAWGTPFSGRTDLQRNLGVPLMGICFLKQARENRIRPVAETEALALILNNTWRPKDDKTMNLLLNGIQQVVEEIPIFELSCTTDPEAAQLSYATMKGMR